MLSISTGSSDGDGSGGSGNWTQAAHMQVVLANHYNSMAHAYHMPTFIYTYACTHTCRLMHVCMYIHIPGNGIPLNFLMVSELIIFIANICYGKRLPLCKCGHVTCTPAIWCQCRRLVQNLEQMQPIFMMPVMLSACYKPTCFLVYVCMYAYMSM